MTSVAKNERRRRLEQTFAASNFDLILTASPANVEYATGHRSVADMTMRGIRQVALISSGRMILVAPAAEGGPALESGIAPDDFVPYGTFFYAGDHPHASMSEVYSDLPDALREALRRMGATSAARVGGDGEATTLLGAIDGQVRASDATRWFTRLRAIKGPAEVELLRRSARLAEEGVQQALDAARPGISERELATTVASTMALGGARPGFVVVTAGERSALADAFPSDRRCGPGDLLRFDVGCVLDGYWSDMARTAVFDEPAPLVRRRYEALLAGEDEQLQSARPGVTTAELFRVAVETVRGAGIPEYRRHHCGHGIGMEVYEPPSVSAGADTRLEPGMVLCLETPFYEVGWGGMMVEDMIVITEDGHERLTVSSRELRTM